MRGLLEAWVARLAECRLEQKAGYNQHASRTELNATCKHEIFNVCWEMQKKGRAEATIKNTRKALNVLAKHADLHKPEVVKGFIAQFDRKNGYKKNLCFAYDNYVKVHNLQWERPNYYVAQKLPKIPTKAKLEMLIANASKKLALAMSISKDTGMRPIEVMNLTPKDIDLEKGFVYPATAKHGSPRRLKLKTATRNLLASYLSKQNVALNDKLFGKWDSQAYSKYYREARDILAKKLNDPSIKTIRLYDLRHFYATMLYSSTRDILLVKQQMGHTKIETTLMYTQLIDASDEDAFTCRTASNVEQATQLIENGFEYVTEMDGTKIFRKRK